jgi:hypothetical protein
MEDNSGLVVDDKTFLVGDQVEIASHMSGESFVGMLTMVSHQDLVLRTGTGVRLSFHLLMLRNGRVSLSLYTTF